MVLQQSPLPRYYIYSFIFIVIANIFFQIDRLELSFIDSVYVFVSVYVIPCPDSGFYNLRLGDRGHYGYG